MLKINIICFLTQLDPTLSLISISFPQEFIFSCPLFDISQFIDIHYKFSSKGWFVDDKDVFFCSNIFQFAPKVNFPGTFIFICFCVS